MTSPTYWTSERLPRLLVLDLDGVLWPETLAETDNLPNVDQSFIQLLRELDRRGTLIACVSKNNQSVAEPILGKNKIDYLFAAKLIEYVHKPPAIKEILQKFRVEPEDAVFVDDSLSEREEAKQFLPNLRCLNPEEAKGLLATCLAITQKSLTCDAQLRKEHYVREEERTYIGAASLAQVSNAVASSALSVFMFQAANQDLMRCAELYSRTHRLNFAARRRTLLDLTNLQKSDQHFIYAMCAADRYGPYGLVGCAILAIEGPWLIVEDLVLSCRVQARRVEHSVLVALIKLARGRGIKQCRVRFSPTVYNAHLESVLRELSFSRDTSNSDMWFRTVGDARQFNHTVAPKVIFDRPQIKDSQGGIPFVCNELKRWSRQVIFTNPVASVGSGYDDVLGEDWETWLIPQADRMLVTRIDIQSLAKVDVIDNAESLTSIPDGRFGTVLCLDMLEHAEHPWKIPPTILRILKEDGIAIFSVPCILGIHCESMDLWRLTPAGLRRLIETTVQESDNRFGFQICDISIEGIAAYPIRSLIMAQKRLRRPW